MGLSVLFMGIILAVIGIALIFPIFGHYAIWQMPLGFGLSAGGFTHILLYFVRLPGWSVPLVYIGFVVAEILFLTLLFIGTERLFSKKRKKSPPPPT